MASKLSTLFLLTQDTSNQRDVADTILGRERQYRLRITQWGRDKKVKSHEMAAIVRKRQKRKLVETDKRELVFDVRGTQVELPKIERWMKRHEVADSFLYSPSPAACKTTRH
jgi:hypothetical protein